MGGRGRGTAGGLLAWHGKDCRASAWAVDAGGNETLDIRVLRKPTASGGSRASFRRSGEAPARRRHCRGSGNTSLRGLGHGKDGDRHFSASGTWPHSFLVSVSWVQTRTLRQMLVLSHFKDENIEGLNDSPRVTWLR